MMDKIFADALSEAFRPLGLLPDKEQTAKFYSYMTLIEKWNEKINLISEKSAADLVERHFADSVSLVMAFPDWERESAGKEVIDVGSGAGLPGIPLKIMYPRIRLTLLDSQSKRTDFLKAAAEELALSETRVIRSRAEDAGADPAYRERYDYCVSRAVAPLKVLLEFCLPFVKVGGIFVAYKSAEADEELRAAAEALRTLGGEAINVCRFSLGDAQRALVVIKKTGATPEKYPRKAGKPAKKPL